MTRDRKEYCHFMGYQPPAVSSQKAQLAAKNRKLLQASQHVTGLSATTPGALSESGFPENGQRSDLHRNLSAVSDSSIYIFSFNDFFLA